MNIRKDVEKLIYWYIPIYIFVWIFSIFFTSYLKTFHTPAPDLIAYVLFPAGWIMKYLDNIVIAIWIYSTTKKTNQKYILWSLFGLVAHLFAVVIYLVIIVIEKKNIFSDDSSKVD